MGGGDEGGRGHAVCCTLLERANAGRCQVSSRANRLDEIIPLRGVVVFSRGKARWLPFDVHFMVTVRCETEHERW